ncbi:MAG: class IV adenylate cyclase [Candidatus Bathyarchaeota archaeon]|jgi:predicted adenylyl cyclase CyaB
MNLSEHTLVELKAKVSNLKPVRRKLNELKAEHVGTFRQTDTYLGVPKGRLKLRKSNSEKTQLIYYERDSLPKPKRSDVFVMEIPESKAFPALLKRILKARATVKKTREIYRHQGTQIHLDTVDAIGCYVEFERKTPNTRGQIESNTGLLEELMETLGIKAGALEKMSYGDLVNLE